MTKEIEEPISIDCRPKKKALSESLKKREERNRRKKIKKSHEGATSFEFWFVVNFLARNYIRTVHTNALLSLVVTLLRTLSQTCSQANRWTHIHIHVYLHIYTYYIYERRQAHTRAHTYQNRHTLDACTLCRYRSRTHIRNAHVESHTYTIHAQLCTRKSKYPRERVSR